MNRYRYSSTAPSCWASSTPAASSSARAKAAAESYPPYNVEDRGDGGLAHHPGGGGLLARPARGDASRTANWWSPAARRTTPPRPEDAYLHRGIAARGFIRSFVLADGMEVERRDPGARPAAHRSGAAGAGKTRGQGADPHRRR